MFKKPFLPLRLQLFAEPEGTPKDTLSRGFRSMHSADRSASTKRKSKFK